MRGKLEHWRRLLTSNVEDGRQLLREVLVGPMRFTCQQDRRRYRFDGEAAPAPPIEWGVVGVPTYVASHRDSGLEALCESTTTSSVTWGFVPVRVER